MSDVTTREPGQVYARERSMSKAQEGEGSPWDVEVDVYLESVSCSRRRTAILCFTIADMMDSTSTSIFMT